MKPHPHIRKTVKWGGAVATSILLVAWIGSAFVWVLAFSGAGTSVELWNGRISSSVQQGSFRLPRQLVVDRAPRIRLQWLPVWKGTQPDRWEYALPLWIPAGIILLATCAAWRLDVLARRRARVGRCPKCNYDRTGLAAGAICPECGAAAQPSIP